MSFFCTSFLQLILLCLFYVQEKDQTMNLNPDLYYNCATVSVLSVASEQTKLVLLVFFLSRKCRRAAFLCIKKNG